MSNKVCRVESLVLVCHDAILTLIGVPTFFQGHTDGHLAFFDSATGTLVVGDHCVG